MNPGGGRKPGVNWSRGGRKALSSLEMSKVPTWKELLTRESKLLDDDRRELEESDGNTSIFNKYLAQENFLDHTLYTNALNPSHFVRTMQLLGGPAWVFTQYKMAQILGFGIIGQVTCPLLGVNCFLKSLTLLWAMNTPRSFQSPECGVYQVLRMFEEDELAEFKQHISFLRPHKADSGIVLLALFGIFAAALIGTGAFFHTDPASRSTGDYLVFVANFILTVLWPFHSYLITPWFFVVCKKFRKLIKRTRLIEEDMWGRVDVKMCFENFFIMSRVVENFTRTFAVYFFVVEFTLMLIFIFLCVSMYDECVQYNSGSYETREGDSKELARWRLAYLGQYITLLLCVIYNVFGAACGITSAVDKTAG